MKGVFWVPCVDVCPGMSAALGCGNAAGQAGAMPCVDGLSFALPRRGMVVAAAVRWAAARALTWSVCQRRCLP